MIISQHRSPERSEKGLASEWCAGSGMDVRDDWVEDNIATCPVCRFQVMAWGERSSNSKRRVAKRKRSHASRSKSVGRVKKRRMLTRVRRTGLAAMKARGYGVMRHSPASAERLAKSLTKVQRSGLAWAIEDNEFSYNRLQLEKTVKSLVARGLLYPQTEDTWGGATPLGYEVWKYARPAWIREHEIGAAYR